MGLVALVVVRQLGGSLLRDIDPGLLLVAVILIPPLAMLQFQRAYLLGRGRLLAYNGVNLSVSYQF